MEGGESMRAVVYEAFGVAPEIRTVGDPEPTTHGVVINVEASGVCRSDWHAWGGHDPVIQLPHVPGHELAGTIASVGHDVTKWSVGDRVTVPFVGGCGSCAECATGNEQVCDDQFQPGFTHWGSFAEQVAVDQADLNLIGLPESMSFTTAASLGCRFVTAFRGVVDRAQVQPDQWVAVHGCGGVGLSAVMIAKAMGTQVIAIDVSSNSLKLATELGADAVVDASATGDVVGAVREVSGGGAHVSIDALGLPETCTNSIRSLRKRGRHIQLGWMLGDASSPAVPMDLVMGNELEILGSHGMQAHRYSEMMPMIESGLLQPERLIFETISLEQSIDALANFEKHNRAGITVITDF